MSKIKLYLLVLVILLAAAPGNAQEQFSAQIIFYKNLPLSNISISIFDGLREQQLEGDKVDSIVEITGYLYSKFAVIIVNYEGDSLRQYNSKYFCIAGKKATIRFEQPEKIINPLVNFRLSNALEADSLGKADMDAYVLPETTVLSAVLKQSRTEGMSQGIIRQSEGLAKSIIKKKLQFIISNPSLYYSFWIFHRDIIKSDIAAKYDSLLYVYYTIFPDEYKKTREGDEIVSILNSKIKIENMDIVVDLPFPKDINGKRVSLFEGDRAYVLLNFWATWCSPCMEKIPFLSEIRNEYPASRLKMIGVSQDSDSDSLVFAKTIKQYKMNWTHIFGHHELIQFFGTYAIPKLYLIDPSGKIIYNLDLVNGFDSGLKELRTILREKLK